MKKNRIALLLWLILTAGLHIFGNDFGTRVIFFASVIVPILMVALTGITALSIAISLSHPNKSKSGEGVNILVAITGGNLLPGHVKFRVLMKNLFTGESWEEDMILNPGTHMPADLFIEMNNCGMVSISAIQVAAVDIFGLSAWKAAPAPCNHVLFMPNLMDTQLTINPSTKAVLDSEDYSMHHSGSDPSETFAIREYIPGDSLRSIHWKLSQKTDKLLVRELGLPVKDKVLLLLETSVPGDIKEVEYSRISEIGTVIYSVSHKLISFDILHNLGWMDTTSGLYVSREIANHNDLDNAFAELLSTEVKHCGTSTIETYSTEPDINAPSHVIIAGLVIPQDATKALSQSTVTIIGGVDDIAQLEVGSS
ncbi:MAG: DUF58 domain-containing protein [Defluviitaleaceae bacterium]|nr:DUF58 domain-containing protein [Defluviitaleaceae bacterium]